MFSSVPADFLESFDKKTNPVTSLSTKSDEPIIEVAKRRPKTASSIKTTMQSGKLRKVNEFSAEETKDLMLMLVKNNNTNANMNLKSQNFKVSITNEHISSELCQIL